MKPKEITRVFLRDVYDKVVDTERAAMEHRITVGYTERMVGLIKTGVLTKEEVLACSAPQSLNMKVLEHHFKEGPAKESPAKSAAKPTSKSPVKTPSTTKASPSVGDPCGRSAPAPSPSSC